MCKLDDQGGNYPKVIMLYLQACTSLISYDPGHHDAHDQLAETIKPRTQQTHSVNYAYVHACAKCGSKLSK